MSARISRIPGWATGGLLGLLVIRVSYFAWSNPDGFSRLVMRSGGRIVKKMADHPARVAAFLAGSVVLLWVLIAVRCAWEAWREQRNSPVDRGLSHFSD